MYSYHFHIFPVINNATRDGNIRVVIMLNNYISKLLSKIFLSTYSMPTIYKFSLLYIPVRVIITFLF